MVAYKGSFGGKSLNIQNINISTDIKAKREEAADKQKKATDALQSLMARDQAHISQWSAAGRMTDKSKAVDLANWATMWDGMESLTGALVDHAKREKDKKISIGQDAASLYGETNAALARNEEILDVLYDDSIKGDETEDWLLKQGVEQDFINDWKAWGRHQKWGYRLGAMQLHAAQIDQSRETFIEQSKDKYDDNGNLIEQGTPFLLTDSGGTQSKFTVSDDTLHKLTRTQLDAIGSAHIREQEKSVREIYNFNDELVRKYWLKGAIKAKNKWVNDKAALSSKARLYEEEQSEYNWVNVEFNAFADSPDPSKYDTTKLDKYGSNLLSKLNLIYKKKFLDGDLDGDYKVESAKAFQRFFEDKIQDLEGDKLQAWGDFAERIFTQQRDDLPAGWKKLDDSNQISSTEILTKVVSRQEALSNAKTKRVSQQVKQAVNNIIETKYKEKYKAGTPLDTIVADSVKDARTILDSIPGSRNNKENIDLAMSLATWEPEILNNYESNQKMNRLQTDHGVIIPAAEVIRFEEDSLQTHQERRGVYVRPGPAFGEGHNSDLYEERLGAIDSAIDPGRGAGTFSIYGYSEKGKTEAIRTVAKKEAEILAQKWAIAQFRESGNKTWPDDLDALNAVLPQYLKEIEDGKANGSLFNGRWKIVNGRWKNYDLASKLDHKKLKTNPYDMAINEVRNLKVRGGVSTKDILSKNIFKDIPEALEMVDGQPGYTVQMVAKHLNISPLEAQQRFQANLEGAVWDQKAKDAAWGLTPEAGDLAGAGFDFTHPAIKDIVATTSKPYCTDKTAAERTLCRIQGEPILERMWESIGTTNEIDPKIFKTYFESYEKNEPWQKRIWKAAYQSGVPLEKIPQYIKILNHQGGGFLIQDDSDLSGA